MGPLVAAIYELTRKTQKVKQSQKITPSCTVLTWSFKRGVCSDMAIYFSKLVYSRYEADELTRGIYKVGRPRSRVASHMTSITCPYAHAQTEDARRNLMRKPNGSLLIVTC